MHDGCVSRTIRMVENGIKRIYVFDGKPPQLKSGVVGRFINVNCRAESIDIFLQLAKRFEKRQEANEEEEEAKETGESAFRFV